MSLTVIEQKAENMARACIGYGAPVPGQFSLMNKHSPCLRDFPIEKEQLPSQQTTIFQDNQSCDGVGTGETNRLSSREAAIC